MKRLAILVAMAALTISTDASATAGWRVFDGTTCSGDGGNCYPEDIIIKGSRVFLRNLTAFEMAVAKGQTGAYFSSEKWKFLFARLASDRKTLDILKSGIPIYRLDRPNGTRFYVATRLSKGALLRRIEVSRPGRTIKGVEACFLVRRMRS